VSHEGRHTQYSTVLFFGKVTKVQYVAMLVHSSIFDGQADLKIFCILYFEL